MNTKLFFCCVVFICAKTNYAQELSGSLLKPSFHNNSNDIVIKQRSDRKQNILHTTTSIQVQGLTKPIVENNSSTPFNYTVSTLAGQNLAGSTDGQGYSASLSSPSSVAVDANGNVYVADATNNKIRKITPSGVVSTFAGKNEAGKKDGDIKSASFYYPSGVAIDKKGNLYVADKGNHKIRKITPVGMVSTLAGTGERNSTDGVAEKACFDKPVALAVDVEGNVYVADAANNKIRKITPQGFVTTLAGSGELGNQDGNGKTASFYNPSGIAVDSAGNVFVADYGNNRIRKITVSGLVSTVAGSDTFGNKDGNTENATFFYPNAIAIDGNENIYITDQINHKIRKLNPAGEITTVAGTGTPGAVDGAGIMASFNYPAGLTLDDAGNIYVADQLNCKIRKLVPQEKLN